MRGFIRGDAPPRRGLQIHPPLIRITHWLNAVAIVVMIGSGWRIYQDEVIFGWIQFPDWLSIGGDPAVAFKLHEDLGLAGALQWHFAAMWLLFVNGLVYLAYGIVSGRLRRKLFPIRLREVWRNVVDALKLQLSHDDIRRYNAAQRLLYFGVILTIVLQVLSGLAIWKPVQFQWLTALLYDFQTARKVHFFGMAAIFCFIVIHVVLALAVPKTIAAMVTGGPPENDRAEAVAQPGE